MKDTKKIDSKEVQLNIKISEGSYNALGLIKLHEKKTFKELIEGWITMEFYKLHREGAFKDLMPKAPS